MYPRNAASPEPIAIGAVVQISDGAVQTSGVTVRIKPIGVAEADGTGTTAYSTDGIVEYTPVQSETNYTSFILIAKKTGCIPVSLTVITSASATVGYTGIDWAKILAPTTTVGLSGTTVGTVTTNTDMRGTNSAATATALATHDTKLDGVDAKTTNLPSDPADQSLIVDATNALGTLINAVQADLDNGTDGLGALKTLIDAVIAVTSQFSFTVANQVDANALTGGGGGTAADIADAVWTELIADHSGVSGSTAESLSLAQSAGDPWSTDLPGSYSGLDAGAILSGINTLLSVASVTPANSETKSLTAAVGSTESKTVVCNTSVDALTLSVSVQTKSGTVVDTVVDGSITKSGSNATFALTSTMTASERILRVLITNTATSAQVASPILSVEYDT